MNLQENSMCSTKLEYALFSRKPSRWWNAELARWVE